MMFTEEILPGTWLVRLKRFEDMRGNFVKTYSPPLFEQCETGFEMREEFYSVSNKDVIRGMHFQLPPYDHIKLVYCPVGAVEDVLLDLRSGPGYGNVAKVRLCGDQPSLVIIPKGVAHGFCALVDGSLMVYKTSTVYVSTADAGISWNSFGHDWGISKPIMSDRDRRHPSLDSFVTPF